MAEKTKYPTLNLPEAGLRIRKTGLRPDRISRPEKLEIWDPLRKKWLVLTPEEWVRQHFIAFLTGHRGMDPYRIVQEHQLEINGFKRRADIVVYSKQGEAQLIVECKAPGIKVTQDVFDQVAQYNIQLEVPYLVVTNGMEHYCSRIDFKEKSYCFIPEIPEL